MGSCNQELARRMARGKVSLYASYSFLNSLCSLLACRLTFPRLILLAGFAGSWYPNKWACLQAKCYHGIHTNTSSDTEYLVTTREFSKAAYLQEKIFPCLITYDTGCHTLLTALLKQFNKLINPKGKWPEYKTWQSHSNQHFNSRCWHSIFCPRQSYSNFIFSLLWTLTGTPFYPGKAWSSISSLPSFFYPIPGA